MQNPENIKFTKIDRLFSPNNGGTIYRILLNGKEEKEFDPKKVIIPEPEFEMLLLGHVLILQEELNKK